jgi:CBS domain-containing protein
MVFVRQVLSQKGSRIHTVTPDTALGEVVKVMSDYDIGVVVVVELGEIKGIFSERDFTRAYAGDETLNLNTPVADLMTHDVLSVNPDTSIDECMSIMTDYRIRHLPVVEKNKLIGMISIGDLVKAMIAERDGTIRGLENYILGTDYNR